MKPPDRLSYSHGKIPACIPTASKKVPDRPDWIHEIKQDGYRLLVQRDQDQVKLITRNGHDWTKKYPWIVDAARRIRTAQFVLDGEACILGVDGVADFDDLHTQSTMTKCSFMPSTSCRSTATTSGNCRCTFERTSYPGCWRAASVQLAPFEQGEIGPDLFKAACDMGVEDPVSKRRDRP